MCGITGMVWTGETPPPDPTVLRRMTDALVHRGPDDAGYYFSGLPGREWNGVTPVEVTAEAGAAFGFRRLSIIDLSTGHQPLANEDRTVWIVFNGEIYNYRELQAGLTSRGHRFRTHSDTETIIHLYEELGPACVDRLRGMFAFAIWDEPRRRLLLARDRLGKKPLVYRHEPGRLMFASELKSLLTIPGVPREVDPPAVLEYLTYQYVPHPHSILRGFAKLPPAHRAVWQDGRLEVERYWTPGFERGGRKPVETEEHSDRPAVPRTQAEARSMLRSTLGEAVQLRLRSDVPLGAFLSGGVDSTIIAGLMQQLSSRPVRTFSIGFPVKSFDERHYARLAATHLGTEHHELEVEPRALEILPHLIWHYDEPFADSSAIPSLYLSQLTRRSVTVALSGDGGDELFAGYDRYRAVGLGQWYDRLPGPLQWMVSNRLWQAIPASTRQKSKRRRLKRLLSALRYTPTRRYLKWISIFDDERLPGLLSEQMRETLRQEDPARFLLRHYLECPNRDFVTRTTCADLLTYLPCDILNKVDIASMACSLEVRSPFLDQRVVELAASLPLSWKLRGARGKQILLETFGDLLPPAIQKRPKMGFGIPLDVWFRGVLRPLVEETLLDERSLARGWFQPTAVEQLVREHLENRWDHSYRLWSLLVFELWQRHFVDSPTVPAPPEGRPLRPVA
jgi:asparagine synthase (glutamine-hydrolysing)